MSITAWMENLRDFIGRSMNWFTGTNCAKWLRILAYVLEGAGIVLLLGVLFYNHFWAGFLLAPWIVFYVFRRKRGAEEKAKAKLLCSFKDGMICLSNSLSAGYSLENALREAVSELKLLHGERDRTVIGFRKILHRVDLNRPIEEAFFEFAEECRLEEIRYFAEVLIEAQKNGGNLIAIMRNTAEMIRERIEVEEEIKTMTTAKRFEQNIMNAIPILIVLYMRLTSGGMMERLYDNPLGIGVMTGCLIVYFAGKQLAEHMIRISV